MRKALDVSKKYTVKTFVVFFSIFLFHFSVVYLYYFLINFLNFSGFEILLSDVFSKLVSSVIFLLLLPLINSALTIWFSETGRMWPRAFVFFIGVFVFISIPVVVLAY